MTTPVTSSVSPASTRRQLKAGTTGWTADDLEDPRIARQWERGRYEIVEGVLTLMPPAYYDGSVPVGRVERFVYRYLEENKKDGVFTHEVDFIVGRLRVAKADAILMTREDERRQREAHARRIQGGARSRPRLRFGRLLVPPTLVIESLSPGHEEHDQETKRQWYTEAGVPNYWLLDAYRQSLDCLVLDGGAYRIDQAGRGKDVVRPSLFPGLAILLAEVWDD